MNRTPKSRPAERSLPPSRQKRITLRRFVLVIVSGAASLLICHRTGGDRVLALLATPVIFGALDHWVGREFDESGRC